MVGPVLIIERLKARVRDVESSETSGSRSCVTGVKRAERNVRVVKEA